MESGKWKGKKRVPELRFPEFEGEWEEKNLGEISTYSSYGMNAAAKSYDGKNKYLRITDIDEETNKYKSNNLVSPDAKLEKRFLLSEGDILFARTGASVGKTYYYKKEDGRVYYAGYLIKFRMQKDYDYKFIFYNTLTDKYKNWVKIMSMRSGQPGINAKEYSEWNITIPSLSEQQKIGDFFYKIDKKLELQQQRIEALKEYKKGMMQKIFSQEIRFKDDNGKDYPEWEEKRLGEVAKNSNIKYKDYNKFDQLLSVTLNDGIKKQSELGEIDNSSEDKSNYKVVRKNNVVYNTMRMWQGASGVSRYNGIVSSAYVVLELEKDINPKFIGYYFKLPEIIYKFFENSQGMTSDTLTLRYNLFEKIKVNLPSLPEQTKIANFLSSLDKKIELEEEKLENFKQFKKGLMQKMFI